MFRCKPKYLRCLQTLSICLSIWIQTPDYGKCCALAGDLRSHWQAWETYYWSWEKTPVKKTLEERKYEKENLNHGFPLSSPILTCVTHLSLDFVRCLLHHLVILYLFTLWTLRILCSSGPPNPRVWHLWVQPTVGQKYLEKNSRIFQNVKLEFAVHIYIAFTLY